MNHNQLVTLLQKTNKENPSAKDKEAISTYLKGHPTAWKEIGDVAIVTRRHIVSSLKNTLLIETTQLGLRDLEEQFGYDMAPPLERLLIENILNCWLLYHMVENKYSTVTIEGATLTLGEYWEKKLTAVQRRYLRSIETLAKVRKMKLPAIQVNIGEKQVNVVGSH